MQSKLIKMNIFLSESSQIRVETMKNHGNHPLFERAQLSDAFEFANFEICYRYVLPELRSFSGSIGLVPAIAGRDSKSREKLHLIRLLVELAMCTGLMTLCVTTR